MSPLQLQRAVDFTLQNADTALSKLPLDMRYINAQALRKAGVTKGGLRKPPSLRRDFPSEWLPTVNEPLELPPRTGKLPGKRYVLPKVFKQPVSASVSFHVTPIGIFFAGFLSFYIP